MMSSQPGAGANPKPNPNLKNSENPKNVYNIARIPVEFPYKPYGAQFSFMYRVISTLDRAQKEGRCHALLESPTGTGKSLSLLCSTLAWQQNYALKNLQGNLPHSTPAPEAITDPLGHGGGFIPETQHLSIPPSESSQPPQQAANSKKKKKKLAPVIYYASRTHSQISQVIREYRKTSYRVPMAVLASRKHYCTNPHVLRKENIDEECKLLLRNREEGCFEYKNMLKVKCHSSLRKGGCHEVHDIEDLVKVGQVVKGCAFYAARYMADDAQLVFCPYSYIINPVIRGAMDVDIKGAILILDEAHNLEDIAREAGSVDLEEDALLKLQMELEQLHMINASIYQPLYEMTRDLIGWIEQRKSKLEEHEFQHYLSFWTGDKALRQLEEANISQQCFPILLDCATKAIRAASDAESDVPHLSGNSVIALEGLFSSLTYFFSRNGSHMFDYQLALQRYLKKDGKNAFGSWICSLSLWCLNPAVVFRDIADLSFSVILTSGTLSPMNSFSSELGVQFGNCLEAPHVIDVKSQVWSAIISHGPGNYRLDASYKTTDQYAFQDALGKSLEEICKIVPGGSLIFFPSYKLMEKLCNRWRKTGQWSRLNARKPLFVEPRGGNQEEFETVMKDYYDSISRGKKAALGRKRRMKKTEDNVIESTEVTNRKGAAFLAVFRGKVSEGIDFSDDNARVVIVVGIPFPNVNDIQVTLKKKYNDTYKSSKHLLSGSEWYCHQAFRALNQALGRCIRHKYDYGAIILLDWRFEQEKYRAYISKWLRPFIRKYESFESTLDELRSFFRDVKDLVGKKKQPPSLAKYDATFPQMKLQSDVAVQTSVQVDKHKKICKEYIDLECGSPKDSRCFETSSITFSSEDPDFLMVKETPFVDSVISVASPGSLSKYGNSGSNIIQASTKCPDQFLSQPMSSTSLNEEPSIYESMTMFTPEKGADQNTSSLIPKTESPLNLSVCSYIQKRRKFMGSPFINLVDEGGSDTPAQIPGSMSFEELANGDIPRRIEFETSSAENNPKESNIPWPLATDNTIFFCPVMDKRLRISCLLCRGPLGRPENQLYLSCSLTVSSKAYVLSLFKQRFICRDSNTLPTVKVIITDISLVDPRLWNRALEGDREQGIWREDDGCVFKKVFCPFCSNPNNCLGVQIKAADEKNLQLLNKILLYFDFLEIKNPEDAGDEAAKDKDFLQVNGSSTDKTAVLNSISKFAYSPKQPGLGGGSRRTTKSKVRYKEML
ncbi:Fanconi anemia group J protein [Durio zibethinus]|uniref:DNA 5'-3' helicase FANCJ n=1 Tax=Durio zibethinus TaxID=66656 RepID=A0A6P6AXB5_DURZI|nr:Fanconi anemia group J protein [Durio zibethinus]